MIRLLQVELKKIFKKKSIYIIWGLMLIFCLLNNILYWTDYDEDGNYKYLEQENLKEEQTRLETELAKYNKENSNEVTMYITIKTKLDILTLKQKFPKDSWQYRKINTYLYDIVYQINYYKYIEKANKKIIQKQEEYQLIINKLNKDDYQYFLNIDIQKNIDTQKELDKKYNQETDEKVKQELEQQLSDNKFNLKILNYRLNYNIKENNNYLNIALENYQENYKTVKYYNSQNSIKTYQKKLDYQEALSETTISKYIIEHQQNINKQNNLNYQLRTIIDDYEILIIMLILIVCSSLICDEFKDGTIKLLLIKPYSRGKILLSKYFTAIIIVITSILMLIALQLIVGGIIFKFDSLNIPIIIYDFNKSKLVEYSVFQYMIIRIFAKAPFLLMLITISIFLGVISNSTIISITMPLLLYMFNPTFIHLANKYQLDFMKYLVNINWNLQDYLFGKLPELSFINSKFSVIVLIGYFTVLWILTFSIFQKKNIKNI